MVQPSKKSGKREAIPNTTDESTTSQATTKTKPSKSTSKKAAKGSRKLSKGKKPDRPCYRLDSLPAELRNRVYDHLLDPGSLRACHPQILATCKQINNEASGILYGNNQFLLLINGGQVHAQGVWCGNVILSDERVDLKKARWPPFLKKVQNLRIELARYPYAPKYTAPTLNGRLNRPTNHVKQPMPVLGHILYSLCYYLSADGEHGKSEDGGETSKLTALEIVFTAHQASHGYPHRCRCLESALLPLALLGKVPELNISGYAPATIDGLAKRIASFHPNRNLLHKYDAEVEEAEACQSILQLLEEEQPVLAKSVRNGLQRVRSYTQPANNHFVNRNWEGGLSSVGKELRGLLKEINTDDLTNALEEKMERVISGFRNMRRRFKGGA